MNYADTKDLKPGKLYRLTYIPKECISSVDGHVIMVLALDVTLSYIRVLDGKEIYLLNTQNFDLKEIQ